MKLASWLILGAMILSIAYVIVGVRQVELSRNPFHLRSVSIPCTLSVIVQPVEKSSDDRLAVHRTGANSYYVEGPIYPGESFQIGGGQ